MLLAFLLYPAPGLVKRHARQRTAHASLLAEIRSLQAGKTPPALAARPQPPLELLSDSEIRVLRYLPTNPSITEIANHLYVSSNTVKTHIRHLYESSAHTGAARPSPVPAPSACSHPLDGADPTARSLSSQAQLRRMGAGLPRAGLRELDTFDARWFALLVLWRGSDVSPWLRTTSRIL
jgi:DNA-binding CsgD family transcriptional regulator